MTDALWRLGVTEEQLKALPASTQRFLREAAEDVDKWNTALEKRESDILADRNLSTLGRQDAIQALRKEHTGRVEGLLSKWSNVFDQALSLIKSEEAERRLDSINVMRKTLGDVGAGEVIRQRISSMDGNAIEALIAEAQRLGSDWEVEATKVHALTQLLEREWQDSRLIAVPHDKRRGLGFRPGDRDLLDTLRPENFADSAAALMNGISGTLRKSIAGGGDNAERQRFAEFVRRM